MNKKELLEKLDELADGDDDKEVLEIRRLIESSDKRTVSREQVEKWVNKLSIWHLPATQILAIVEEIIYGVGAEVAQEKP